MEIGKDIFISYSNENIHEVTKLVRAIESYGAKCWFQIDDSKLDFLSEIDKGISNSKAFVVFISNASVRSFMVKNEITRAVTQLSEDPDYKIIPVIIEEIALEDFHRLTILLGSVNWIFAKNYYSDYELAKRVLSDANIGIIGQKKNDNYNPTNKTEKNRLLTQAQLLNMHVRTTISKLLPVNSILDVGCANGQGVMLKIRDIPYSNFCGIDVNTTEINEAINKFGDDKHTFLNCNIFDEAFFSSISQYLEEKNLPGFDLVFISYVLLHVEEPLKLLRRVKSVMNSKGMIIIQDHDDGVSLVYPQEEYFDNVFTLWKNALDSGDRFMARKIPSLLTEAGFKNIAMKKSSFTSLDYKGEYKEALWDFFFNVDYWDIHDALDFHDSSVFSLYEKCVKEHTAIKKRYMNGEFFICLGMFIFVANNS